MRRLIQCLLRYSPRLVTLAIISGLVTGSCSTLLIALITKAIDNRGNSPITLALGFAGVCLLLPITRVVSQALLAYLTEMAVFDLRMYLAREILAMPLRKLESYGPSKLLSILTYDIEMISASLSEIPLVCTNLAIVVTGFGYLFWLFWPGAIAMLLAAVLGVVLFAKLIAIGRGYFERAREEKDTFFDHFRALTVGSKELKLNNRRKLFFLSKMLKVVGTSHQKNNVRGGIYFAGASSVAHFIAFSVAGILVFVLPYLFPSVSTEVMTGFSIFLLYLMMPLNTLTQILPSFSVAVISLEKVESLGIPLEKFSGDIVVEADELEPRTTWNSIELKGITHTYYREEDDDNFKLDPIDLVLKPGEMVFIVGGNGSGKTTLAKLILGLYTPESGQIWLDGELISDQNRNAMRQYFTAVFSDFFLFENMMDICPPDSDETARNYLKRLQLDRKVKFEKGQLSTLDLSQGQRKRLALLTAYLEDRPIYLFDEWAADQDPAFKDVFYHATLPDLKARGKTIIVISHDDHYYHVADRIVKLDYGRLEYDRMKRRNFA